MKFMLLMNSPRDGYTQFMSWPRKILALRGNFMRPLKLFRSQY